MFLVVVVQGPGAGSSNCPDSSTLTPSRERSDCSTSSSANSDALDGLFVPLMTDRLGTAHARTRRGGNARRGGTEEETGG